MGILTHECQQGKLVSISLSVKTRLPNSPLVAGAGAGTLHPVVLLVRVLVQPLPAVVEGGLDTAHAGEAVHGALGGAEAGVAAQPVGGERLGTGTGRTPTPPAHHTDDGVWLAGRTQVRLVEAVLAERAGGTGDHR